MIFFYFYKIVLFCFVSFFLGKAYVCPAYQISIKRIDILPNKGNYSIVNAIQTNEMQINKNQNTVIDFDTNNKDNNNLGIQNKGQESEIPPAFSEKPELNDLINEGQIQQQNKPNYQWLNNFDLNDFDITNEDFTEID